MNRIISLLAGIALTTAGTAWGAELPWLTFTLTDSSTFSVAAEDLTLDYADGSLRLSSPTVDRTVPVAQLAAMEFTAESGGSFVAELPAEGAVAFFELNGTSAGTFRTLDEARKALAPGVYVVVSDGQTFKVAL